MLYSMAYSTFNSKPSVFDAILSALDGFIKESSEAQVEKLKETSWDTLKEIAVIVPIVFAMKDDPLSKDVELMRKVLKALSRGIQRRRNDLRVTREWLKKKRDEELNSHSPHFESNSRSEKNTSAGGTSTVRFQHSGVGGRSASVLSGSDGSSSDGSSSNVANDAGPVHEYAQFRGHSSRTSKPISVSKAIEIKKLVVDDNSSTSDSATDDSSDGE